MRVDGVKAPQHRGTPRSRVPVERPLEKLRAVDARFQGRGGLARAVVLAEGRVRRVDVSYHSTLERLSYFTHGREESTPDAVQEESIFIYGFIHYFLGLF